MTFALLTTCERMQSKHRITIALVTTALLLCGKELPADDGSIDLPLPQPSANAAVHYQRGLLFLYSVDPAKRELLKKPIWEILRGLSDPDQLAATNSLLLESRHAIRAAAAGSQRGTADFGVEPGHYVQSTLLPHAEGMVDLSKVVLLHGAQLESEGDWDGSAQVFAQVLRMGRHMSQQTTLVEALTGTRILEGGYYALGLWAVRCPERGLVDQASLIMNMLGRGSVDPARTMFFELRYVTLQLTQLENAYPDGNWAEMILAATGAVAPYADQSEIRKAAIEAAVKNGVPASVFESKEAFDKHIATLRSQHLALAREVAAAMTLPTIPAIRRGQEIHEKFAPLLRELGDSTSLHPGQLAAHFAVHDAELAIVKVVLALAASKDENGFPAKLDDVAIRFGGKVPRSPYDGSALTYRVHEDRSGFELAVPKASVGDIELPKIEFRFAPPDDTQ